ncbi:MAG: 5-formyltetrahydrofolate cyclo-ligase [Alistipes sp.]|nr:5-formyltetrahydrofolate cyclo-ligase [Alistipes sp.]MBQ1979633.1 5-formyltetrahydrofolate cyclo-ligase [Alistipes sp.]
MDKSEIRRAMRQRNRTLDHGAREAASERIFRQVEQCEEFRCAEDVALYCALPDEPPTEPVIARWLELGKRVVVPRVEGDEMRFFRYDPATQVVGAFGIEEPGDGALLCSPSEIELMVVPGVAFTATGDRMGRGRGYYDKYLSQSDFRAYTIGVGYAHQLVDTLPVAEHDRRLDKVVVG